MKDWMPKDFVWALKSRIGRLYALYAAPRGGVLAEIGVWQGGFSRRILQLRKPRELHLIDPWLFVPSLPERMYGGSVAKGQSDMDAIMASVVKQFADSPAVRVHRDTSLEAAKRFTERYFDWVYIDGDHSCGAVLSDLNTWFPKLKIGGTVVLDDYTWQDESRTLSVKAAAEKFISDNPGHKTRLVQGQFLIQRLS
jgi:hypothetical protein